METPANITATSFLEKFNNWLQESIMIKLLSIGFLLLILLIPVSWIQDLMTERQNRANEVTREIAGKLGSQTVCGPILVIPYKHQEIIDRGNDGKEIHETVEKAFFLPEQLDVNTVMNPEILHRGIFDAVVYESSLNITSTFKTPDFKKLSINEGHVLWDEAYMVFGITDHRGISSNFSFTVGDDTLTAEPSGNIGVSVRRKSTSPVTTSDEIAPDYVIDGMSTNGIVTKLDWQSKDSFNGDVKINLNLKGSQRLDFIPAGKTTNVKVTSVWADPSFDGEFLPSTRVINNDGFSATWTILHFNRPFPQQWTDEGQNLGNSDFGVKLILPVDQYQKSIRTAKYGVLIVLLTFIALFLVEITTKVRIHPFQYILIGAALTIYYTLLLSFSEHIGYNLAYIISSLATVILISLYSKTFLANNGLVLLFTMFLITFYVFIFVIILQQDFSLLIGSVGLFLIIGILMYFSRKVRWYGQS